MEKNYHNLKNANADESQKRENTHNILQIK